MSRATPKNDWEFSFSNKIGQVALDEKHADSLFDLVSGWQEDFFEEKKHELIEDLLQEITLVDFVSRLLKAAFNNLTNVVADLSLEVNELRESNLKLKKQLHELTIDLLLNDKGGDDEEGSLMKIYGGFEDMRQIPICRYTKTSDKPKLDCGPGANEANEEGEDEDSSDADNTKDKDEDNSDAENSENLQKSGSHNKEIIDLTEENNGGEDKDSGAENTEDLIPNSPKKNTHVAMHHFFGSKALISKTILNSDDDVSADLLDCSEDLLDDELDNEKGKKISAKLGDSPIPYALFDLEEEEGEEEKVKKEETGKKRRRSLRQTNQKNGTKLNSPKKVGAPSESKYYQQAYIAIVEHWCRTQSVQAR